MPRKVGDQNAKTVQWRKFVSYALNGGLTRFQNELNKLQGKDYVQAYINILEFHMPRLSRVDNQMTVEDKRLEVNRTVITKSAT